MLDNANTTRRISIVPPATAGEKLLFRVFDHASPIGYARLRKIRTQTNTLPEASNKQVDDGTYELKMIEVSQNYRHTGVGTTLLQEVIQYCQEHHIDRLTGDIKGDLRKLRHWYHNNGFAVDSRGHLELSHTLSI